MESGKDFSLRGFEKTLNPKTVRYLNSKTNQLDKLDLRQISDNVVAELRGLQNEAAFDYLKIEGETYELLGEIENADGILAELEGVLKSFRDGLSDVKNEMTFLQEKSLNMNISLNNRKGLSKTFAGFIENVMLEPTLIDDILQAPIDDNYVESIRRLCMKLDYIKKYNLTDNLCVREIEPELAKLKIKACERIRTFVLEEVSLLKKPKTNIQVIQQNKLAKYKVLLLFLRDHNQPIFFEIVQVYSDTLNKIYNHNLGLYSNEINKLLDPKFTKLPLLVPPNNEASRASLMVLEIGDRKEIVEDVNQQPIITHVAQKQNQLFAAEALFKSLNRMLVETVGQEYSFCQNFFSLNDEQAAVLFAGIFKQTIMNVMGRVKAWLSTCQDPYTPLLISAITAKSREKLNQKGYDILDHYFDQITFSCWPRFSEIYDALTAPLNQPVSSAISQQESEVGLENYYANICALLRGLTGCSHYHRDSQMLQHRVSRLLELTFKYLNSISEMEKTPKDRKLGALKRLNVVEKETAIPPGLNENDRFNLEKEVDTQVGHLVDELQLQYYGSLVDFAKKGRDADANPDAHNLALVENISKEFSDTWASRFTSLKAECETKLGKTAITKKVLKKLINSVLENYTTFFNCVKASYPSFTQSMLPLHKLSLEIKNQILALDN